MKYSVIMVNNDAMSLLVAATEKPSQAGVEGVRDYLTWQQGLKIYSIKNKDKQAIYDWVESNFPEKQIDWANNGVDIPYAMMEIFASDGKDYARINTKVKFDSSNVMLGFNLQCPVCDTTYFVKSITDETKLPMCDNCSYALKKVIMNERLKSLDAAL